MRVTEMDMTKIIPLFLLLSCCCSIFCFPSRPLNERSTELAWEAWLLVDDQNRHNNPDTPTRSRITPKSVFIAPTFSPENLPSCGEGYRADKSGTCMQIIKLDENAHLEFLLQKLNEKFGSFEEDYDTSQEEYPTPGPFQVNIPLDGDGGEDMDSNPEIAIVVAPTNNNFDQGRDEVKHVKRTEGKGTGEGGTDERGTDERGTYESGPSENGDQKVGDVSNLMAEAADEKPYDMTRIDEKLTDEKLTDEKLIDETLTDETLTDEKLTDVKLTDEKVTDEKVTDEKLTDEKLTDGKLSEEKLADETLTIEKMTDEIIRDQKVAVEKLSKGKLADEKLIDEELINGEGDEEVTEKKLVETTPVEENDATTTILPISTITANEPTTILANLEDKTDITTQTETSQDATTTELSEQALFFLDGLSDPQPNVRTPMDGHGNNQELLTDQEPQQQIVKKVTVEAANTKPKTRDENNTNKPNFEEIMYSDADMQGDDVIVKSSQKLRSPLPLEIHQSRPFESRPFESRPLDAYSLRPIVTYPPKQFESYSSRPLGTYSSKPLDTYSSKPLDTYSSEPLDTYSSRPLDTYSSRPLDTYSSKPLDAYSSKPLDAYTSRPLGTYSTRSHDTHLHDPHLPQPHNTHPSRPHNLRPSQPHDDHPSKPQNAQASSVIKFPDEPANVQRKKTPNVEEIEALIRDLIHTKGADTKPNDQHVFRHRDPPIALPHHSNPGLDPDIRHKQHVNHGHGSEPNENHRIFNHRNRDKWNVQQPSFREPSPYNPIVLKFSNRPHGGRQVNQELFHQRHHPEGVYRKVPDDLSYVFGLKARSHVSHR